MPRPYVNYISDDAIAPAPKHALPTLRPQVPRDLLLAPVAVAIDRNLQQLRDLPLDALRSELGDPERATTRDERAALVRQFAIHDVDTRHWSSEITPDGARLRLSGGSVPLELGLSRTLCCYIEGSER